MQMICPECGRIESFERLPMRLQTCGACARHGSDTYLTVPALERRQPVPQKLPTGRALLERRKLRQQRPAV